jgi:hypothetical protein
VQPVFNFNYITLEELAQVSPDVTKGTTRIRTFTTLQTWFVESKLADLSPYYDFMSVRVGSQPFLSDFRGFIFSDVNRMVRLFGTLNSNQQQFNFIVTDQMEKDTNSGLNKLDEDRHQNVMVANLYWQDFVFPGYTQEFSLHYNHDQPSIKFDTNKFLVRPDPVGTFTPHQVQALYFGLAGDGHIDRFNISNAFYWVIGRDTLNPIGNQPQDINAQMAACELSYDRDWARFRTSVFWASGDGNVNNRHATGFDTILDNPNFGGEFSYFFRQNIPLFGINLTQRQSIVPDMRSSKIQGQSNFVNPGLFFINMGFDADITPRLRSINNCNFLWFDKTNVLEQYLFVSRIDRQIGTDLSTGFEYRPLLSNNVIITSGLGLLIPELGFRQLYNRFNGSTNSLLSAFMQVELTY